MAKGKNLNPADAQRKAERKKELKKNKAERQKTRDFALVKKDTTDLEEEILRLEKAETDKTITTAERTQLPTLRAELKRINKKKEDYVAEHPEHRKLVYRVHNVKTEETEGVEGEGKKKDRKVFDKNGIPRHPERSIYYDPVMNPFGVPPPGMHYMERPLRPDEVDSQSEDETESEGGSDDDIVMPSGPPPSKTASDDKADEIDSDSDIPLPEGPPPLKVQPPLPPLPPPPIALPSFLPAASLPFPPGAPPPPFPYPPQMQFAPPVTSGFSYPSVPPPPGWPAVPPPPPGLPPRPRIQSEASMQDPLSSAPHQPFQAYHTNQAQNKDRFHNKPTDASVPSTQSQAQAASTSAGTISAPAQLRDFKKESTAFMPLSIQRKRTAGPSSNLPSSKRINAAPVSSDVEKGAAGDSEPTLARPDLLGTLQSNLPAFSHKQDTEKVEVKRKQDTTDVKQGKDDYAKFMEEIGDIL